MPFLSPNQQCQSTEGKISHSMDLLTPSSPGCLPTLSLTINSSCLPWRRVVMPLISPLMPIPQVVLPSSLRHYNRLTDYYMKSVHNAPISPTMWGLVSNPLISYHLPVSPLIISSACSKSQAALFAYLHITK